MQSNSLSTARAAFLYLYEVGPRCQQNYLGTVTLDKPTIDIGLPKDKLLLLTAEFAAVGRFSQSSTRNVYSYLLQPRPGYDYAAVIQQQERLYKFTLTERRHGSNTSHVVERKGLEQHCAPNS